MANYNGTMEDASGNKLLNTPHSYATIETGTTASQPYVIGDGVVFNNQFCEVTAAIPSGGTLAIGTNLLVKTVGDIGKQLIASDGKSFNFDVLDGKYGYYPSASKVSSEFVPFGGTSVEMASIVSNSRSGSFTVTKSTAMVIFNYYAATSSISLYKNGKGISLPTFYATGYSRMSVDSTVSIGDIYSFSMSGGSDNQTGSIFAIYN